jgi:tetratricopeptide (TPR) repeat protein
MQWWYPLIICVAAFGLYAPTLTHRFVWDDPHWLERKIRFYSGLLDPWFEPGRLYAYQVYRPLSQTTYLLDQRLWWRNPLGFHLTSVVLHAVTSTLVYGLARTLGIGRPAALVGGLLFAVHPVQVESVAWVTSRVDILATAFAILAVWAFVGTSRDPGWKRVAAVGLCSFAAAASKETGCWVPLLVLAARYGLAFPGGRPPVRGIVASALGVVAYLLLRPSDAATGIDLTSFDAAAALRMVYSLGYHVERLVFPYGFQPYVPEVPVGAGMLVMAALGAAAMATLALLGGGVGSRMRFAAMWLFLALTSAVLVVLAGLSVTPVAEHRLYLAVVALALLVADALARWPGILRSRLGIIGVSLVLAGCASITVQRSLYWKDDITLWSAVIARGASDGTPYLNLGLALDQSRRRAEAEDAYRKALQMPARPATRQRAYIGLGYVVMEDTRLDEAVALFTSANAIVPDAVAYCGLGTVARYRAIAAARAGDTALAAREHAQGLEAADAALGLDPLNYHAHYLRAGLLLDEKSYTTALEHLRRVVELAGDTDVGKDAAAGIRDVYTLQAAQGTGSSVPP